MAEENLKYEVTRKENLLLPLQRRNCENYSDILIPENSNVQDINRQILNGKKVKFAEIPDEDCKIPITESQGIFDEELYWRKEGTEGYPLAKIRHHPLNDLEIKKPRSQESKKEDYLFGGYPHNPVYVNHLKYTTIKVTKRKRSKKYRKYRRRRQSKEMKKKFRDLYSQNYVNPIMESRRNQDTIDTPDVGTVALDLEANTLKDILNSKLPGDSIDKYVYSKIDLRREGIFYHNNNKSILCLPFKEFKKYEDIPSYVKGIHRSPDGTQMILLPCSTTVEHVVLCLMYRDERSFILTSDQKTVKEETLRDELSYCFHKQFGTRFEFEVIEKEPKQDRNDCVVHVCHYLEEIMCNNKVEYSDISAPNVTLIRETLLSLQRKEENCWDAIQESAMPFLTLPEAEATSEIGDNVSMESGINAYINAVPDNGPMQDVILSSEDDNLIQWLHPKVDAIQETGETLPDDKTTSEIGDNESMESGINAYINAVPDNGHVQDAILSSDDDALIPSRHSQELHGLF